MGENTVSLIMAVLITFAVFALGMKAYGAVTKEDERAFNQYQLVVEQTQALLDVGQPGNYREFLFNYRYDEDEHQWTYKGTIFAFDDSEAVPRSIPESDGFVCTTETQMGLLYKNHAYRDEFPHQKVAAACGDRACLCFSPLAISCDPTDSEDRYESFYAAYKGISECHSFQTPRGYERVQLLYAFVAGEGHRTSIKEGATPTIRITHVRPGTQVYPGKTGECHQGSFCLYTRYIT